MKKMTLLSLFLGFTFAVAAADTNAPAWLARPLSLADALNTALQQNATILKAQNDLEASHGLVVQTRAVALPQVKASGQYADEELTLVQNFPGAGSVPHQSWNAGVQICLLYTSPSPRDRQKS